MKYTIPMLPPSLNRFAGRKNHQEYRTLKRVEVLRRAVLYPTPQIPIRKSGCKNHILFPNQKAARPG